VRRRHATMLAAESLALLASTKHSQVRQYLACLHSSYPKSISGGEMAEKKWSRDGSNQEMWLAGSGIGKEGV
jgi:hypothetical protein